MFLRDEYDVGYDMWRFLGLGIVIYIIIYVEKETDSVDVRLC